MKCPKCQFENREEALFCGECGHKFEVACPNCGGTVRARSKFCDLCGHDLSLTSEPAPELKDLSFDEKLGKIQRYLPKGLTEKILAQRNRIEGERKQVTVMFCDMEGFTRLTESLGPEEAYGIMDQVYEILIHKVHDYEGTVNEMTGDGIMALFGAPIALEDAPQRAIRSAIAIHREMARFSDKIKKEIEGIPSPFKMRIGIHTGPVVVGTLGNDLRVEFKAVGDTVNLASRMEGLADPGSTYVSEATFRLSEGFFRFEALGKRQIKGKTESIPVYRVIAASTRRTRFDVSAERGLTAFVGRERELELLLDGFERAKGGRGQAFSIMAEAGVGKSRLLYEFRKAVANEDVTFLEGKCLSYSQGAAYHPIIDVLKSDFDISEEDADYQIKQKVGKRLKALETNDISTLPYLLDLLSVKDSAIDGIPLSPEARKERIYAAFHRIVLKGSEIRPLIIAIEDLHWSDKSSEEFLRRILDGISGARVFLIFTYRPEFVLTWGGKSYHSQVNLSRLSNRESLTMVNHLLGGQNIENALEEFILEKTEGIPFFIEEFIKSLRDLQIIEREDNTYRIAKDIQIVTIPSTIQDVIMARVDSLPEKAKLILQTGAVVGREFSHDLINRLAELPEQELLSYFAALKDSELLYERGLYPQSTYIFKHAFTQEVVYGSLLVRKRKDLHGKIAGIIEDLYANRIEESYETLAYHYSKSDNTTKAYEYMKLSGQKASRNFSTWEAFRFYKDAFQILIREQETEENLKEQLELLCLICGPMRPMGYPEDSLQMLQTGERLSKEIGDEKDVALFRSKLGYYFTSKEGKPLLGIEYSEKSFQVAQRMGDIELLARVAYDLFPSYIISGQFSKILEIAPDLIALIERRGKERESFGTAENVYSYLNVLYGWSMGWCGNFSQGSSFLEKGFRIAAEIDHKGSLGINEMIFGWFYNGKGEGDIAVKHLQNALRYAEEVNFVVLLAVVRAGLGWGYHLLGEQEKARMHAEKGIKIQNDAGVLYHLSRSYFVLSMAHFASGDFRNARISAEKAIELSQNCDEKHFEAISRIWLSRILGRDKKSEVSEVTQHIFEGIKILNELSLKPFSAQGYLFLGELYGNRGQPDEAFKNLKKAEGMFQEMGMDYWLDKTQEILERV
jgi:class 3 adenylate cyclase/tetratricopeptide (TPR) repeat protein